MKVLILGAAGMIGRKLTELLRSNASYNLQNADFILHDIVMPSQVEGSAATCIQGDMSDSAEAAKLAGFRPDIIFYLAAIVSGDAEQNFEKGWEINARGGWSLLEALRAEFDKSNGEYRPKLVFSSSIAVFGGPYPDKIADDFQCAPQTSYGSQKAIVELLVSDYSRKGFIDGISIRLPTIAVRPGKPNLAASSFFSGIIREPLNGQEASLPVPDTIRHWFASPRSAAGFLAHAASLDTDTLKGRRALNMPGISCTVAEQIEALREIAGEDVIKLIRPKADEAIMNIVEGWPRDFAPQRATKLGFKAESSFQEIIQVYLDEDLNPS